MSRLRLLILMSLGLLIAAATARSQPPATSQAAAPDTPAGRWIARGRQMIENSPDKAAGYSVEALGLSHRARETGDPAYYDQAEAAVEKSLEIEPGNFEAEKVRAWILLGQHRYAEARDLAAALNKRVPDDLYCYAFLADADVALGDYDAAEKSAQILLDLRPTSVPALTRGAVLREAFGDPEGALEFYVKAYQLTPADEGEERAWTLTRAAAVALGSGKVDDAGRLIAVARKEFDEYAPALAVAADVLEAQGRGAASADATAKVGEAITLRRRVTELEPQQPDGWHALAALLARAGRASEASDALKQFAALATARKDQPDNANALLVRYLAGPGGDPAAAVALAESELRRRHDLDTLDAAAVALLADGKPEEARATIDRALAVGVQDAAMYFHAGRIAAAQDTPQSRDEAIKFLEDSRRTNEFSPVAKDAGALLAKLYAEAATRPTTNP